MSQALSCKRSSVSASSTARPAAAATGLPPNVLKYPDLEPNASKLALLHLLETLGLKGLDWIDIQVLTPHLEVFGARELSRDDFRQHFANFSF